MGSNLPDPGFEERVRQILREEIQAVYDKIKTDALLNGWPKVTYQVPSCKRCMDTARIWSTDGSGHTGLVWHACPDCKTGLVDV
jgi:hypothetical protein